MRNRAYGLFLLLFIWFVSTGAAQVSIAPGSEYTLTQNAATGGSAGDNGNVSFTMDSAYDLNSRTIKAQVSGGHSIGTGVANSLIFYDFTVPASPNTIGNTVGAWVSYTTQWQGFQVILATLLTNSSVDSDLILRDLTESRNLRIEPIHALDLKTHSYKFISVGANFNDSGNKTSTFPAVLKRGHSYRLTLSMSCTLMVISPSGTPSLCDYMDGLAGGGDGRVQLNSLNVKVGLDEKEVLQRLESFQNHRHIYLTGRGEGHNNTQAASLTPIEGVKVTVNAEAPVTPDENRPGQANTEASKPD